MAKIKTVSRDIVGKKVKNLRQEGLVPASLFGPKFDSTPVAVDEKEFRSVFENAGYSSLVDVETPDGKKEKVVFKEVQQHPVTDEFIHVSMFVVDPEQPITAEIPFEFIGESKAEKLGEGFVSYALSSVSVKCLPRDLPAYLEVDLTKLETTTDTILVGDVPLPEGVEFDSRTDQNAMVVSIATAQKVEELAAAAEESAAAEDEEAAVPGEEDEEGGAGEDESQVVSGSSDSEEQNKQ